MTNGAYVVQVIDDTERIEGKALTFDIRGFADLWTFSYSQLAQL